MTLKTILKNSEIFTDEKFNEENLISIANKAISRINTECNTLFPFYVSVNDDYTAIPQMWQLDLVSPSVS